MDLEKALERLPRKVMEWAVRKKGLAEVLVQESGLTLCVALGVPSRYMVDVRK